MIAQLHGLLVEATPSVAVVDVSGMGFELGISNTTAALLPSVGQEVLLYTRMQVREDAMTLFGFATKEERTMFDRLVAVSGVGAKLALAVLSTYATAELYTIVMSEDDKAMAKVPGVGKKTAQRLILELKSVFAKDRGLAAASLPTAGQLPLGPGAVGDSASVEDARSALLSMGFTMQEIDLAFDGIEGIRSMQVEQVLAAALKRLGMDA
ncbi:MAG: Holliday junction branch migration protein RuvA [Coriobacteriaceae bacterium]|nr:Holliday junction branch migration protein RuvA [Coriobacteriaceae bacterium]